jgi:hypothetical protein
VDTFLDLGTDFAKDLVDPLQSPRSVYLRPCYNDLVEVICGWFRGSRRPVLVTGTPGIGKTMFGWVLLKKLMERQSPILLLYKTQHHRGSQCHAFYDGTTYHVKDIDVVLEHLVDSPIFDKGTDCTIEIWNITDTVVPEPSHLWVNTVLVCSPGLADTQSQIKIWKKDHSAKRFVVPPCSWDEILQIRSALYHETSDVVVPLDIVETRFRKWGGVPSRILSRDEDDIRACEDRFEELNISDAIRYLGKPNMNHTDISGAFFHLFPSFGVNEKEQVVSLTDLYGAQPGYWWASEDLASQAWANFVTQAEANVIDYIENLRNNPINRGHAWEEQIHHLIATAGISGKIRKLGDPDCVETTFQIKRLSSKRFLALDDIDDSATYWRPAHHNHKSSDSYIPEDGLMLQITTASVHGINVQGIYNSLTSGIFGQWENDNGGSPRFLFIVHPLAYDDFTMQEFGHSKSNKKGLTEAIKRMQLERVQDVEQWVMSVDLKERLKVIRQYHGETTVGGTKNGETEAAVDQAANKKRKLGDSNNGLHQKIARTSEAITPRRSQRKR